MANSAGLLSSHAPEDIAKKNEMLIKYSQNMEEFRIELEKAKDDSLECLVIVDAIQRLCLDYNFQAEIHEILKEQYLVKMTSFEENQNLFEVSLRFRLLRQHGYYVSPDLFGNLVEQQRKFKEFCGNDMKGLMALYEASHASLEGEDLLDETANFSSKLLIDNLPNLEEAKAEAVESTLQFPYYKNLARLMANGFLENLECKKEWQIALRRLAESELTMLQSLYREEKTKVVEWWKELALMEELDLARNQPVKWYMWSMGVLSDPTLSKERIELTKPISLVYIIDDVFDIYGSLDELTLFTQAINRWEISAVEKLPGYMKTCFRAIHETTVEISSSINKDHGWNPESYLRLAWAKLCNAFLREARWLGSGKAPKAEEYLKNGIISSGVPLVLLHLLFLLGHVEKDNNPDFEDTPEIISSVATVLRLIDDLGSARDEDQDGKDGSYTELYMEEQLCSGEIAREHVMRLVSELWKKLNKQCLLCQNKFPASFINACLNVARMVPLMYSYDGNQHLVALQRDLIRSLF